MVGGICSLTVLLRINPKNKQMKNIYYCIAICVGINFNTVHAQQNLAIKKGSKTYFEMPKDITSEDYSAQTLIFKVKPEYRKFCNNESINISALQEVLSDLVIDQFFKPFPNHKAPEKPTNKLGQKLADLSLIYRLKYSSGTPIEDAVNLLYQTGVLEYVCLSVTPNPLYTPNDTYTASQYHLTNISAFQAWDIEKGDTNVVIGITDTGFKLDHEDLGNVKFNYADPIDGLDNDSDNYIDNYKGWDIAYEDNDPTYSSHSHGVGIAGIASATTDNGKGLSGVGFNCKYLPVKCMADFGSGIMYNTYEAIVYAADHNCKVINCSWGGTTTAGQFGQDVITYATINKDALVVASAGNNGNEDVFYPASYDYVMSVAGSDSYDLKWSGSCYGANIDITAPGKSVYYTSKSGGYGTGSGTSESAPIVSGAAAIIRSHYPNLTALEVMQLLKVSSDIIDTMSGNSAYVSKLGAGRLNMYNALIDSTSPGITLWSKNITDNNDENFYTNDTLEISCQFANLL